MSGPIRGVVNLLPSAPAAGRAAVSKEPARAGGIPAGPWEEFSPVSVMKVLFVGPAAAGAEPP